MTRPAAVWILTLVISSIGCASPGKERDVDAEVNGTTEDGDPLEEIDPGTFESCSTQFRFAATSPEVGSTVSVDDAPSISARLVDAPNVTEMEACNGKFTVHFAIDTNDDPAVSDWLHLPADVVWTWEGARTWQVDIEPAAGIHPNAHYAVELSLQMDDALPLGDIWVWKTE